MRHFAIRSRWSKRKCLISFEEKDSEQYYNALEYVKKKNKTKNYPKGCNDGIDLIKFYFKEHKVNYEIKMF